MKKVLKIAAYDFKRLVFNPITVIGLVLVLIACFVTGLAYKIEPTPAYSAVTSGEYTRRVYQNFRSTDPSIDTENSLNNILAETNDILATNQTCLDYEILEELNATFQNIKNEVEKFEQFGECAYYENGISDISHVQEAAEDLNAFTTRMSDLEAFETNVIFTNSEFEDLVSVTNYFNEIDYSANVVEILENLYENSANFEKLSAVAQNVLDWNISAETATELQTKYITKAEEKCTQILAEMETLNNSIEESDVEHLQDMKNLITNFKLVCESAKAGVENELRLLLEKNFENLKNLYHFDQIKTENIEQALVLCNYFLENDELYFKQYQVPLNFNTGSYEVTVYDHAYFLMSIVGFLTIIFAIFCAYKLFGRDRKSGKIDTILSQNVSFNQVYTAKFLAIIFSTSFILAIFSILTLLGGSLLYPSLANGMLAVFNLSSVYIIHPFLFFIIKIVGIELHVIFYSVLTVFLMNISRKFDLCFGIALAIFAVATICNIFLNGSFVYCLLPFIHADLTSFLGGATMETGFLRTSLYAYGNFFVSLVYYLVFVVLLYNLTKQIFKKN